MKLIFLDVDGVLNSELWYTTREKKKHASKDEYELSEFDPRPVAHLNELTSSTGAKIVVSSSWRKGRTVDQLQELFRQAGITGEVIDKTPCLYFERPNNESYSSVPRGCEIKAWFEANKGILGAKITKVAYVIFDDDSDMLYWQRNNYIQTDRYCGLTGQNTFKAKQILSQFEHY